MYSGKAPGLERIDKMAFFDYSPELVEAGKKAMELCAPQFAEFDRMAEYNGERVLKAFIDNRISDIHMKGTNGYGYGDDGRDKLDAVFAQILGAEDALVRHNFVNGTHAITTALFGILRPGDELLSVTGDPYDTMQGVISGDGIGSLKDFGVKFGKVDLLPDGTPDYDGIKSRAGTCRMAYIQRSRGYSLRPSLSIEVIAKICEAVRSVNPDCVIFTDNCYGELVEEKEPVSVGADLIAGSLIKNLGGGIAETGGLSVLSAKLQRVAYLLRSLYLVHFLLLSALKPCLLLAGVVQISVLDGGLAIHRHDYSHGVRRGGFAARNSYLGQRYRAGDYLPVAVHLDIGNTRRAGAPLNLVEISAHRVACHEVALKRYSRLESGNCAGAVTAVAEVGRGIHVLVQRVRAVLERIAHGLIGRTVTCGRGVDEHFDLVVQLNTRYLG